MKLNKHTFFSTLFLFIFISAFSTGIYSSLSDSFKTFSHTSFHKEIKQNGATSTTNDLVFEETENDGEESANADFILILHFSDFSSISNILISCFSEFLYSEKSGGPIFIAIRSIRI